MIDINQEAPELPSPGRCGSCRHAVRPSAFDDSLIACLIRLEYYAADLCPECRYFAASKRVPGGTRRAN